jgi:hypothetical protein
MKKLLAAGFLFCAGCCGNVYGDDGWVPYVYRPPVLVQQASAVPVAPYYYVVPMVTMVPVVPQFVPVTVYQNVLVERRYHCFFKRYEILTVPQTFYVPNRY